jgi:hypothetical protein
VPIGGDFLGNVTQSGIGCPFNDTLVRQQIQQGPKEDALACTIWSDDRQVITAINLKVQAVDDGATPQPDREVPH